MICLHLVKQSTRIPSTLFLEQTSSFCTTFTLLVLFLELLLGSGSFVPSFTEDRVLTLPLRGVFLNLAVYGFPAAAKSLQSCPTLCDPIDGSPPGFPIPGILQARILEWVAISFSNAWKGKGKVKSLSRVRLLATPWTAAYQAPPSMGFSRQEYWSGLPLPSP